MKKGKKLTNQQELIMIKEHNEGVSRAELIEIYGITKVRFQAIQRKKYYKITFDEDLFFNKLKEEFTTLKPSELAKKFTISLYRVKDVKTKTTLTNKKMLEWLQILDVPYTSEVVMTRNGDKQNHAFNYNGYYVEPIVKRESTYNMLPIQLEDYNEKLGLVESQTKVLKSLLQEKELSGILQTRIMKLVNTIARESLYVGIAASKGGYADKLEYAINHKGEN